MTNSFDNYPMLADRQHTQFVLDLLSPPMSVNGSSMSQGVWNLIVTKRDLSLWTQFKMKPHRNWKVSQVKTYFGLTGRGQKLFDQFMALKAEVDAAIADQKEVK
jgi:hypothetical protein